LNRQVVGPTCVHDSASDGTIASVLSRVTSVSSTRTLMLLVRFSFCECGSVVCMSPRPAQRNVLASTALARIVARRASRAKASR